MQIIVVLMAFILLSCNNNSKDTGKFEKLEWLLGNWQRFETKPDMSGHEQWTKVSDTEYQGFAFTLNKKDTIFSERMNLVFKDGGYEFGAFTSDNKEPVYFRMTSLTDTGFICENLTHDFPKKISYAKRENSFFAFVTDGKDTVNFSFRKL